MEEEMKKLRFVQMDKHTYTQSYFVYYLVAVFELLVAVCVFTHFACPYINNLLGDETHSKFDNLCFLVLTSTVMFFFQCAVFSYHYSKMHIPDDNDDSYPSRSSSVYAFLFLNSFSINLFCFYFLTHLGKNAFLISIPTTSLFLETKIEGGGVAGEPSVPYIEGGGVVGEPKVVPYSRFVILYVASMVSLMAGMRGYCPYLI